MGVQRVSREETMTLRGGKRPVAKAHNNNNKQ